MPREAGDKVIPDAHYRVDLRLRLRVPVCTEGAICHHRWENGTICGETLDKWGWHALKCGCGCSRTARHDGLQDWNGAHHAETTCDSVGKEQRVTAWRRRSSTWPPATPPQACLSLLTELSPANTAPTPLAGRLGQTRMGWLAAKSWTKSESGTRRQAVHWCQRLWRHTAAPATSWSRLSALTDTA